MPHFSRMSFAIQTLKADQIYEELKAGACSRKCQAALLSRVAAFWPDR